MMLVDRGGIGRGVLARFRVVFWKKQQILRQQDVVKGEQPLLLRTKQINANKTR